MDAAALAALAHRVRSSVEAVIVGKSDVIEQALVAVLCEGHILIEDVPGIGKTMLAKALARSLGCSFRRLQCTPDLLPSDITGLEFFNQRAQAFEFRPGPIFAQIVLADEVNRATPRTQSALLESMEERQVTVEGQTRPLPRPFVVLATQNPIELQGTFPLPEAQLDRFLLRLALGYPSTADEREILRRYRTGRPLEDLQPVSSPDEVLAAVAAVREVYVSPAIEAYVVALAQATRAHPEVELGLSPRGSLGLHRTAQALAAVRGRGFVLPDDVKAMAPAVCAHRLVLSSGARLRDRTALEICHEVLRNTPAPVEREARP
ncbi:MAG: MoxR family ATPase [Armatimonadota bacterium]|nr:MoxR family ATPase [Armatimonadota bacterium]MDR7420962.1 MoxR family ATPase [Armatimonadota bacterium]MDR7455243.1 MoxR family ATPase [Armatimonadota bacterium]MDR7457647.1 MoxR family ATPase [Armatimonadota bacterium]MDR7497884.1 MoxR family ATPase [Armatimonadota bacterium]